MQELIASWRLSLRAANRSEHTQSQYLASVEQFARFLEASGLPTDLPNVGREHVEAYLADVGAKWKTATVQTRYKGLRLFFQWAEGEDEIERSPMEKMRPPLVPEQPVPVLTEDQLRALLQACDGKAFDDRRDNAIIRLRVDTGMRTGELIGVEVNDVDVGGGLAMSWGKVGGSERARSATARRWRSTATSDCGECIRTRRCRGYCWVLTAVRRVRPRPDAGSPWRPGRPRLIEWHACLGRRAGVPEPVVRRSYQAEVIASSPVGQECVH